MSMIPTTGPGVGIEPRTDTVRLTAHAGLSKGDLVAISTVVTDGKFGTTIAVNDTTPYDLITDNGVGVFAVALETISSGAEGRFATAGIVDVLISGGPALGKAVTASSSGAAVEAVLNDKIIGYMLEAGVTATTKKVMFDGYNGFGIKGA